MSDTKYKVRGRGKWDWRDFNTVRMEISVGQPYHEAEKLQATMDWARDNFKRRVIILGDAPQRYNLMFQQGYSEEMAQAAAIKAGNEWLERNRTYLYGIEITRWDEWKNMPIYPVVEKKISDLYSTNKDFHSGLYDATTELWLRRYAGKNHDKDRFFSLSEKYLLEETSVFAVAYDALGGISAYPGDFLKIWERFINAEGQEIPTGLSKAFFTRLSFEKKRGRRWQQHKWNRPSSSPIPTPLAVS